jgi:coenzyme F420-dependent glucose-6-phosphate dehydrogenase
MGTSVVTPTLRYHPAIVAHATATLGCLDPGRVFLGVGTGEAMNEVPVGVAWPDQKERFARLREACELMKRLWTEERVTYEGTYYQTHMATLYDRPDPPPGLYVAASGPAAARLAGRLADGFICTSGKAPELYRDTLIPAVHEGLAKAGRDRSEIELTIEMKVSYDTDRQRALQDTRYWGALALSAEEKVGVEDPVEMERLADALPVERTASRFIVGSDPEEQVEGIRPYLELGFTHLVFHHPGPDQARFLRLYAESVLPRLRELHASG